MTLSDTVSSCCQDHGLGRRVASDIAERVMDRLAEEAEQGCTVAAVLLRPIDREALRAELLEAGRLLTEPRSEPYAAAFRVGGVSMVLLTIAREVGMPDVADEIRAMIQAEHRRVMAGFSDRRAALAPLASDDWLDGAEPEMERDRRASEVAAP